jgi:hypothetical protein
MERDPQSPLFITLVHGTWPKGFLPFLSRTTGWYEDGSEFRSTLQHCLSCGHLRKPETAVQRDIEFFKLKWSGSNSVFARQVAAKQLAELLLKQRSDHPKAERIVIAHSHGGNIAINALRYETGADERPIRIVTIATPFLEIVRVTDPREAERRNFVSRALFASAMVSVPVAVSSWNEWGFIVLAPFALLPILTPYLIAREYFDESDLRTANIVEAAQPVHNLAELAEILILRGIDDEASISLSLGSAINRFTALLVSALPLMIARILLWTIAILFPILIFSSILGVPRIVHWSEYLLSHAVLLCLALSSIACLAIQAVPIGKSFFGKELFWGSDQFEIAVNSAPDAAGSMVLKTIKQNLLTRGTLRHALYENPACIKSIVSWLVRDEAVTDCDLDGERKARNY